MDTVNLPVGMGGHERAYEGQTNDWLTPLEIIKDLGPFDLDPAANSLYPSRCATNGYSSEGLSRQWEGRIWLNPPYGPHVGAWLERLANHGNGIALIFARTETKTFFKYVWEEADALLFLEGRLRFLRPNLSIPQANAGAPSVLVAYGIENKIALHTSSLKGKYIKL